MFKLANNLDVNLVGSKKSQECHTKVDMPPIDCPCIVLMRFYAFRLRFKEFCILFNFASPKDDLYSGKNIITSER